MIQNEDAERLPACPGGVLKVSESLTPGSYRNVHFLCKVTLF
jgi:hypothetical protein